MEPSDNDEGLARMSTRDLTMIEVASPYKIPPTHLDFAQCLIKMECYVTRDVGES